MTRTTTEEAAIESDASASAGMLPDQTVTPDQPTEAPVGPIESPPNAPTELGSNDQSFASLFELVTKQMGAHVSVLGL